MKSLRYALDLDTSPDKCERSALTLICAGAKSARCDFYSHASRSPSSSFSPASICLVPMTLSTEHKNFLTRWLKGIWRATVRFLKREKILHPEALPSDVPTAPDGCRIEPTIQPHAPQPATPPLPGIDTTPGVPIPPLPNARPTTNIPDPKPPEPFKSVRAEEDGVRLHAIAPDGTPIPRKP